MASANNPHPDSTVHPDPKTSADKAPPVKTEPNPAGSWPYPIFPTDDNQS